MFYNINGGEKKVTRTPPAEKKLETPSSNVGKDTQGTDDSSAIDTTEQAGGSNAKVAAEQPGGSNATGAAQQNGGSGQGPLRRKLKALDRTIRELIEFAKPKNNVHKEISRGPWARWPQQ